MQAALRLRASKEQSAWLRLRGMNVEIAAVQEALEQIRNEKSRVRAEQVERLRVGATGRDLHASDTKFFERQEQRVAEVLKMCFARREAARELLAEARKRREVVENAIERERREYFREQSRLEQTRMDDETLQRMSRERRQGSLD